MKMKTRNYSFALIAFLLLLSSCGPSLEERRAEIETSLKSWVGKSETELVAKWGAPTRSYKTMDGSRELTYIYTHTSNSPGYAWRDYWGNLHFSHPVRNQSKTERSFTVDQSGTIVAYHWVGY
jgi:hypothetical protein